MKPQNRYLKHSHIKESTFKEILKEFSYDSSVTETAKRTGISRQTITKIYQALRLRILEWTREEADGVLSGEGEIDESYFGARRVRGKRGRGAVSKIPVFGILKRNGSVYTKIVKNCSKAQLLPILHGKVLDGTTVYSDGWKPYDGLIHNYKHHRVYHSHNEFARGKNHINGIESFWSWAKRRMIKFNGVRKEYFYLHLKESEWRFNHRQDDVYLLLLKLLKVNPLVY